MCVYLVGSSGNGEENMSGPMESFRDSGWQRCCHPQHMNSRLFGSQQQLAYKGEEKGWTMGGPCEPLLAVGCSGKRNERFCWWMHQPKGGGWRGGESVLIVQLSLSNYSLKIIYKLWDYCCKGHNLFLWLFDLFCWLSSRSWSVIGGTSMSGSLDVSCSTAISPRDILSLFGHLKSPRLRRRHKVFPKFHKDGKLLQAMSRVYKTTSNRKIELFTVVKNTGGLKSFK